MRSVGRTDIGLVRKINEDSFLCEKLEGVDNTYLYIVADGMGGHNAGEVASSMAVQETTSYIKQNFEKITSGDEDILDLIRKAVLRANDIIYKTSLIESNCTGMGTTLSMALIKDNAMYAGHVGDSRIYLIRDKEIKRLTEDHSLVAELIKNGSIKPEEAKNHPQKNVITRALGTEYTLDVDVFRYELKDGDYMLFCTDGLSNLVSESEIMASIKNAKDIDEASEVLMDKAKEKGGFDNITVIIIHMCKGGESDGR